MSALHPDYTHANLVGALRKLDIGRGDVLFLHADLDALGSLHGAESPARRCELVLGAVREVLGDEGTLLVPTYTFSFCRRELFDVQGTPTPGGPWSPSSDFLEYVRRQPGAHRSADPIHSVAGLGPRAKDLLADVPLTCFGPDCVFDRLRQANGKICLLGLGLHEATFMHHVDEVAGVPFRYKKLFTGQIRNAGATRKTGWIYNVRLMVDNSLPDDQRLEPWARATGICRAAPVGRGEVLAVDAAEYFERLRDELARDPWFTARGPKGDPVALDNARVGEPPPRVQLARGAFMTQMIDELWQLPRNIVSDGYDVALAALQSQLPMTVHEYPIGSECWSWIVPEKWTCQEAYLETLDGRRLFSYQDHQLHVVSYSLPFEGVVPREELLQHLYVDERQPDAVPFIFKYYEREWGLCCSARTRESLRDAAYRVVIRTTFSFSTLKVGEVVARGTSDETIVLCAHLCHPQMVNDDLTGVVVGVDVMRALLARRDLRYTYRFLIVPETIGTVAYLSRNEDLIPDLKGGLFLEMLGNDQPHALQLSFAGNTAIDECFTTALRAGDPDGFTGAFRTLIGNDERQYNAPGMRIPMLSLARVLRPDSPDWPYREYHSSNDTPAIISARRLEESRDLVLRMIDALESDVVPVNVYKGEAFCSRFGVFVDFYTNPEGNKALFDILFLIDGTRSVAQIAKECGISLEAAQGAIDELAQRGVVRLPASVASVESARSTPARPLALNTVLGLVD